MSDDPVAYPQSVARRLAWRAVRLGLLAGLVTLAVPTCRKPPAPNPGEEPPSTPSATVRQADDALIDYKDGPEDAKVKIVAYFPGYHEDTLAAVKAMRSLAPAQVQVEVVDWRSEAGLRRLRATGLSFAGITINGKSAFELNVDGQRRRVLFVRGIGGEWTRADLEAAVRQELEANPAAPD